MQKVLINIGNFCPLISIYLNIYLQHNRFSLDIDLDSIYTEKLLIPAISGIHPVILSKFLLNYTISIG